MKRIKEFTREKQKYEEMHQNFLTKIIRVNKTKAKTQRGKNNDIWSETSQKDVIKNSVPPLKLPHLLRTMTGKEQAIV